MPLYTYTCEKTDCKHEFDELVSLSDVGTKKMECPKCHARAVRKMTAPRVVHSSTANWRR